MLRPVPVSTVRPGYSGFHASEYESSAVSFEANKVRDASRAVVDTVERSQALFARKAIAIDQLWALANECAEENWDGSGAAVIDLAAVLLAERFLRALPDRISLPELAVEPDGAVSLDWLRSPTRLISVSVGASHRLAFAWLDGTDRGHGVARFDGETVPRLIVQHIEAVVGKVDAGFRAS